MKFTPSTEHPFCVILVPFWPFSACFRVIWPNFDHFLPVLGWFRAWEAPFWQFSACFGVIWPNFDHSGLFWADFGPGRPNFDHFRPVLGWFRAWNTMFWPFWDQFFTIFYLFRAWKALFWPFRSWEIPLGLFSGRFRAYFGIFQVIFWGPRRP